MTPTMKAALGGGLVLLAIGACTVAAEDTIDVPTQPVIVSTAPPELKPKGIETGLYVVGVDIAPGTYRAESTEALCLWVRKSLLGGPTEGRIDSGIGRGTHVITVEPTDRALYVSKCGTWTKVELP